MTVSNPTNRNDYVAQAGETQFSYTFKIFASSDLEVYVDNVKQASGYTVSGVGNANGGNVTFDTAPGANKKIAIVRAVPYDQQTVYVDNDKFPAQTTNDALDKLTILAQQLLEKLARSLKFATSSTFKDVDVPDLQPLKFIRCNAAGTGLELVEALNTGSYLNPVTTRGDLIRGSAVGTQERLPLDPAKKMVGNDGTDVVWRTAAEARADLDVPANAEAILKTIADAAGDLIVGTGADTVGRKAVGTASYVLGSDPDAADKLSWLPPALWGTSRISRADATTIQLNVGLIPLKVGNKWVIRPVTAAVTKDTTGLSAGTLYYVYAFDNAGTTTLEFSVTGHATDTTFGVEVKNGDATRTLVGMVRTNGSTQFVDTATQRFVLSWFSRRTLSLVNGFSANRSTTSTSYVEVNTEIRCEFLTWGDEGVGVATTGRVANDTAGQTVSTSVGFDGTTAEDAVAVHGQATNAAGVPALTLYKSGLAEGYHYVTLLGAVSANTGTWSGAAVGTVAGRTSLTAQVRG